MSIILSNRELLEKKFLNLIDRLEKNPYIEYRIAELAQDIGISKYHFHRLFSIIFGVNIYEFIILLRMRAAAKMLKYSRENITTIALECGYSSSQSFSKAFKNHFGKSPREFRNYPDIKKFTQITQRLTNMAKKTMTQKNLDIEITNFAGVKIASLRHKGKPQELYNSIEKFIGWRHSQHLNPAKYNTFNVFHNPLSDDDFDIELGCEFSSKATLANGIEFSQIPSCRCVSLKYIGSPDDVSIPATSLYNWAIESGYEIADYPLFCHRVTFPPFVEEDKSETIIYLPIK